MLLKNIRIKYSNCLIRLNFMDLRELLILKMAMSTIKKYFINISDID